MSISSHRPYIVLIVCLKLICISPIYMSHESIITVKIPENISNGSVVCDLFNVIIPRPNKHATYTLIKNSYFTVDKSQAVVVIGPVDRDKDPELCIDKTLSHSCVWKSVLLSNSAHLLLKIVIEDENDNTPSWPFATATVAVTENMPPTLCNIELPKAKDPDQAPNNTAIYIIDPPSKYVFVVSETRANALTPYLRLRHPIDRELVSSHNVTLLAIDGGIPSRTGTLLLVINIIDINDNIPKFESSIYTHSLSKYTKVNDRLDLKIKASDSDEGINGNITYALSLNTPFVIQNCFSIDSYTAVIIIKKMCNLPEYRFSITAFDNGNPILSGKTDILLLSNPQNQFAPEIQMSAKEPNINIVENNKIGERITTLAVKDKDAGRNGEFQCTLSGNRTEKVSIISNKGSSRDLTIVQVMATGVFDREAESNVVVTITCLDYGAPSLSSTVDIIINVIDENDNMPYFKMKSYHFKTYEENEPYQRLAQLVATDDDIGYNAMLSYRIESPMNDDVTSRLTIDFDGYIIAKERLDREKFSNGFNFTVIATDHGRPPLTGTTEVFLELLDINDNSPAFRRRSYNFSFIEDIGTKHQSRIVGQVSAWDPDIHNNSVVTYTMSSALPLPFKLNPESGEIYSYSLIDRDAQSSHYLFAVLAMDCPGNLLYRRTASVSVYIEILDHNDNRPAFLFPNAENNKVQLSYLSPVGTVVTTVKATDKDTGPNSNMVYSLVDPDRNILFSINEDSGELKTSTVLNSIHEGIENLFIRASDCGTPSLSAVQRLVIEIGEYKPSVLLTDNLDNQNKTPDQFLSDQATYIIIGIVLGTFFICCSLVTGICMMTYRQWRSSRTRATSNRQYVAVQDPNQIQMYLDNYLEMKEMI